MKQIIPNIWFDDNAEEAVNLYTSIFPNSKIGHKMYHTAESAAIASNDVQLASDDAQTAKGVKDLTFRRISIAAEIQLSRVSKTSTSTPAR